MEYCSEQLSRFEMADSDVEEEVVLPEMQCIPEEIACAIGSVKRSLLETLEKADLEKKMKCNMGAAAKWGLVLSNRHFTRGHGNIKNHG